MIPKAHLTINYGFIIYFENKSITFPCFYHTGNTMYFRNTIFHTNGSYPKIVLWNAKKKKNHVRLFSVLTWR